MTNSEIRRAKMSCTGDYATKFLPVDVQRFTGGNYYFRNQLLNMLISQNSVTIREKINIKNNLKYVRKEFTNDLMYMHVYI